MSEVRIDIKTSGDDGPIKKVTQSTNELADAQDRLSNSGKGLATAPSEIFNSPKNQSLPMTMEDLGAIERASAALEKKIVLTQILGGSTIELEAALAKLNLALMGEEAMVLKSARAAEEKALADTVAAEAAANLAAANEAAGLSMAGMSTAVRGLNPLLRGMATESAGAAAGLELLFKPGVLGAAFAASLIYHAVTKEIEELNKILDESAEAGNKQANWQKAVKAGLQNAALEAATFERSLSRIGVVEDEVKFRTEEYVRALERQYNAQRHAANSEKELAEAKIHAREQLEEITHEQALKLKLELDTKFFNEQLDAELKRADAIFKAHIKEFQQEQSRIPDLQKSVAAARGSMVDADSAKTKSDKEIARTEKNIESDEKMMEKSRDAHDAYQKKLEEYLDSQEREQGPLFDKNNSAKLFRENAGVFGSGTSRAEAEQFDAYNSAAANLEKQKQMLAQAETNSKAIAENALKAKENYQAMARALEAALSNAALLKKSLPVEDADFEAKKKENESAKKIRAETDKIKAAGDAGEAARKQRDRNIKEIQEGRPLTNAGDSEAADKVATAISESGDQGPDAMNKLLTVVEQKNAADSKSYAQINSRIDQLAQQVANRRV